jgi:DNA-binding transcriptional regulator YhcF (GntR family)
VGNIGSDSTKLAADGGTSTPRYRQLAASLREQIISGRYGPDSRLPSEHQLAARQGISRVTARQAIQVLEQHGLVRRIRGSGTYVNCLGPGNKPLSQLTHAALLRISIPSAPGYFLKGIESAQRWLASQSAMLSIINMTSKELLEGKLPGLLQSPVVQALLVDGMLTEPHVRIIREAGLPFLVVGNWAVSRAFPQIRFAIGAMVRRAIEFLQSRQPEVPIVMAVHVSSFAYRKEALASYRQAIRASAQKRALVVEWHGDIQGKLNQLVASGCPRFNVILVDRNVAPLMRFVVAQKPPTAGPLIVQISSPEVVEPAERAGHYFIPCSSERIMTEGARVLAEMVRSGKAEHYQEIDASIEAPASI